MQKYDEIKLQYESLFYTFGVDIKGHIKIPDRVKDYIQKLEIKGFILDFEYKQKLLSTEDPMSLMLKPNFSSMPVEYFIEFFDKFVEIAVSRQKPY